MTRRQWNGLGFAACAAMLAFAIFAQKVLGLLPCPLCMFQRFGVAFLGVVFLAAALHDPRSAFGRRAYAVLIGLFALFPAGVATRHLYIQSLPEGSVPSCGATLDYMLEVFPLSTVVRKVLTGGGECAKIDFAFLGISMPGWVLISVLVVAACGIWNNARRAEHVEKYLVTR